MKRSQNLINYQFMTDSDFTWSGVKVLGKQFAENFYYLNKKKESFSLMM